jgi:hypothetical protein
VTLRHEKIGGYYNQLEGRTDVSCRDLNRVSRAADRMFWPLLGTRVEITAQGTAHDLPAASSMRSAYSSSEAAQNIPDRLLSGAYAEITSRRWQTGSIARRRAALALLRA